MCSLTDSFLISRSHIFSRNIVPREFGLTAMIDPGMPVDIEN